MKKYRVSGDFKTDNLDLKCACKMTSTVDRFAQRTFDSSYESDSSCKMAARTCGHVPHAQHAAHVGCYVKHTQDCIRGNNMVYTRHMEENNTKITSRCCDISSLVLRARRACTMKLLRRRLPLLVWLPSYGLSTAVADLIAGVTVGLTVIPQAIAYASVAGLPAQYGLYSSFAACFVYALLGSCRDSPVGPTAIAAILTRENLHGLPPDFAVLLCFLSGCVELLMGILQLGFLIDFISGPVSVGFTSAAAIIIATTQIKDVLGLSFPGGGFLQVWAGLLEHLHQARLWDALLGCSCILILLLLRKIKDLPVGPSDSKESSGLQRFTSRLLWFLSTGRNIIVVIVCAAMAYSFEIHQMSPFALTGHVKEGLPPFAAPPFSSSVGNHTYTFTEMASSMGSAILVVPLLSILENIALAKVFSEGKPVDATQEMLAIGVCNIVSSFFSSMPVSGALSRGAVNHASGVKTTAGGIYTGILVILALQYLTPYFFYIPRASLAAVIIAAVIFMVELHVFKPIWKTKKIDLIPAVVTFLSCLLIRLELGIVIGIGVNLLFLLYASARPSVHVSRAISYPSNIEYLALVPDRSLAFPSAEYVRGVVSKAGLKQAPSPRTPVVLDARHVQAADFTAAEGIKALIDDFYQRGQPFIFYNLKPSIVGVFKGVKPKEFLFCSCPITLDTILQQKQQQQNQNGNTNYIQMSNDKTLTVQFKNTDQNGFCLNQNVHSQNCDRLKTNKPEIIQNPSKLPNVDHNNYLLHDCNELKQNGGVSREVGAEEQNQKVGQPDCKTCLQNGGHTRIANGNGGIATVSERVW